jgi:hypothetical protein
MILLGVRGMNRSMDIRDVFGSQESKRTGMGRRREWDGNARAK